MMDQFLYFPIAVFDSSNLKIFILDSHSVLQKKENMFDVPEVLNVHMNEIYKKRTTVK